MPAAVFDCILHSSPQKDMKTFIYYQGNTIIRCEVNFISYVEHNQPFYNLQNV